MFDDIWSIFLQRWLGSVNPDEQTAMCSLRLLILDGSLERIHSASWSSENPVFAVTIDVVHSGIENCDWMIQGYCVRTLHEYHRVRGSFTFMMISKGAPYGCRRVAVHGQDTMIGIHCLVKGKMNSGYLSQLAR